MELTWHGHSTWGVQCGETMLLIDPFFENPKTDVAPGDLAPDYVLLTHGHADHIADVGAFPDATVVGTPELMAFVADEHAIEDSVGFNMGGTVELGDAHVSMHRSDHTNGIDTTYDVGSAGMPAGYVVSDTDPARATATDATTFYHAGDTSLMVSMREIIAPYLDPDAAAVPIGDHFTMGPAQAAIAVDWLDVDHAFPMHYDTMPVIEQDPAKFEREVQGTDSDAEVHALDGDETVTL